MGGLLAPTAAAHSAQVARLLALFPQLDAQMAQFALDEAGGDVDRAAASLSEALAAEATTRRQTLAEAAEARSSARSSVAKRPLQATSYQANSTPPRSSSAATPLTSKLDPVGVFKPKTMPAEERIRLAAARLVTHPRAVETMRYMITSVLQNPGEEKYRAVKTTNRAFADKVGSAPADVWEGFFRSIGFVLDGEWLRLPAAQVDEWNLLVGRDALDDLCKTPAFRKAKADEDFTLQLERAAADTLPDEIARRAELKRQLPAEPDEGTAGTTRINVTFGGGRYAAARRKFAADDTLGDVVRWLGSAHSTAVVDALQSGAMVLRNETMLDAVVLDVARDGDRTLQALGLWPGAEMAVRRRE